ncbi:helix-turn-helix transcriptional regulator [Shinella sp. JR1-6]|uniref:helix-turn-helix domain-containing protein n=1 Tax=Shinella sp. JR1-6 TaxID=2527671 RepID=UPI00102D5E7C|nr:helix-turn-helix transcriptional regulator [Shinella sp. JR1-6]TAA48938.1 XRE family transcriptional regulator [Shinella sp. JR1-6]
MKPDKMLLKKRGERLRQAREAIGLSVEEASIAFGAAYSTYAAHENGTTPYTLNAAIEYAKRYKVSLDWLVHGVGDGPGDKAKASQTPESALRSSLIAYGIDGGDLPAVFKAIKGFVAETDVEQPQPGRPRDQSELAIRRRAKSP